MPARQVPAEQDFREHTSGLRWARSRPRTVEPLGCIAGPPASRLVLNAGTVLSQRGKRALARHTSDPAERAAVSALRGAPLAAPLGVA
jgi:hypothetical protein